VLNFCLKKERKGWIRKKKKKMQEKIKENCTLSIPLDKNWNQQHH